MWSPYLFRACQSDDPAGSYVCKSTICQWDSSKRQFLRCYIALSFVTAFWVCASIRLVICDGTHTKSTTFQYVVLIAVTFDGNNQVVVLAFAIMDVENAANWVWFKEQLDRDFPGYKCLDEQR